jgi:hypothetical protein
MNLVMVPRGQIEECMSAIYTQFHDKSLYPIYIYYCFQDPIFTGEFKNFCRDSHMFYEINGKEIVSLQQGLTAIATSCAFPSPEIYTSITPDGVIDRISDLDGNTNGVQAKRLIFIYRSPSKLYTLNAREFFQLIDILFEGILRLTKWHPEVLPSVFIGPVSPDMYIVCQSLRASLCSTLLTT